MVDLNYYRDMEENNEEYLSDEEYLMDEEYLSDENNEEDDNIFWNYPTPSLGNLPTLYERWCWSQFNIQLNLTLIPDCERHRDWM